MGTTRMVFQFIAQGDDGVTRAVDKMSRAYENNTAAINRHNAGAATSTKAMDDNAKAADRNNSSLTRMSGTLTSTSRGFSALGAALAFAPAAAAGVGLLGGAVVAAGGAFAATGLAAAGFGAIAVPVLKDAGTAAKAVKTAQDNYNAAIASGTPRAQAYKTEQLAIARAYSDMSPAQIVLSKQLGNISTAWDNVKKAQTPVVAGALQPWLKAVTPLIAALSPIIAKVAPVIHDLGVKMDGIVTSAGFKTFVNFIAGTGSAGLRAAGGSILGVINAFIIILPKFTPLFSSANDAIAKIGPAVLKWAQSKKTADEIKGFMQWFHDNGPVLKGLLENIGKAIVKLAPGLAAGGALQLKVIGDFLGLVARLPPKLAAPITELAGSLLILKKLGVVSVGLKMLGIGGAGAAASTGLWAKLLPGVRFVSGALIATVIIEAIGSNSLQKQGQKDPGISASFAHGIAMIFDQIRHQTAVVWDLTWNNVVVRSRRGVDDAFRQLGVMRHNFAGSFDQIRHDIAHAWDLAWNDTAGRARRGADDAFHQVSNLRHSIASAFDGTRHDIAARWNGAWNDTVSRAARGVGDVSAWLGNMRHNVAHWFDVARSDAASVWNSAWNSTVGRTQRGIGDVTAWISRLPGNIIRIFSNAGIWLYSSGFSIINGLWSGIKGIWNNVYGWFAGLPKQILHALGIHSPPAWAISAGSHIMNGILQGLAGGGSIESFFMGKVGSVFNLAKDAGSSIWHALFGGGGGVERWRGTVLQALRMEGLPASLAGNVLRQMQSESGGNPNAINRWDSNAAAGHPSQGLMQVIPGTFAAYHVAGTSWNILDPLANIAAAIAYGAHGRGFGSGAGQIGSGHGYRWGSWDVPITGPATVHRGEMILPAELASAVRGAIGGGGSSDQLLIAISKKLDTLIQVGAGQGDQFARALDGAARRARAY